MSQPSPDEVCAAARNLVSARHDGPLSPPESAALEPHLARCAECRAYAERLPRLVDLLRSAGPLVPVPDLDARLSRLDAALRAEAPAPATGAARGRKIDWPNTLRPIGKGALVLAFVVGAGVFLHGRWKEFDRPPPDTTPPRMRTDTGPPPPTETEPPPRYPRVVAEAPTEPPPPATDTEPQVDENVHPIPPEHEPGGEFVVRLDEPKAEPPADPTKERDPGATEARPPRPPRERPPLALAALDELIENAQLPRLAPEQRVGVIEMMGQLRFDHPKNYAFHAAVLAERGLLDRFPGANLARRASFAALGRLGTPLAAKTLLEAPIRPAHRDVDAACLLAALSTLEEDPAVRFVAEALVALPIEKDDERRRAAIEALAVQARPVAAGGLIAAYESPKLPETTRREVGAALGATGAEAALAPLQAGLTDARRGGPVRQGAALGLGGLARGASGDRAAACVAALGSAVADRDPSVALAAVRGLVRAGRREAVPLLIDRVDPALEPRPPVRGAAQDALLRLTNQLHADAAGWRAWWRAQADAPLAGLGNARPMPGLRAQRPAFFQLPAQADGVVFVLDHSGSMDAAGKWDLAVFELGRALDALPAEVRFDVVLFADVPQAMSPELVPATGENVRKAKGWVATQGRPRQARTTAIVPALEKALRKLRGADCVYLLSDGADSKLDPAIVRRQVARLNAGRSLPARIHAVLVRAGGAPPVLDDRPPRADDPADVALMKALARDSGGAFVRN